MPNQSQILYDILEKMIDSQISHTALLSNIVKTTEENKVSIRDMDRQNIKYIQEIKDHVTKEEEKLVSLLRDLRDQISSNLVHTDNKFSLLDNKIGKILEEKIKESEENESRNKRIDNYISSRKQISTYIKWIVAVILSMATIIGGIATITEVFGNKSTNKQQENKNNTLDFEKADGSNNSIK